MKKQEVKEASCEGGTGRGIWNNPSPTHTPESRARLKLMKEESRLINLNREKTRRYSRGPMYEQDYDPSVYYPPCYTLRHWQFRPLKRPAEACQAGNSYEREMFRPGPTRDLEKEKRKLQNLSEVEDDPTADIPRRVPLSERDKEMVRYEELLKEIEDRRQFLKDMTALGQERHYTRIINTQIQEQIQEMRALERKWDAEDAKKK